MSFQWLEMRIAEEQERRRREAWTLERLPHAFAELHRHLAACIDAYNGAFGPDAASIRRENHSIGVRVREWRGEVRITAVPALPGFEVERDGATLAIEIGVLPGDKLFYRDCAADQYLTMDELTRRILDRALFPKLKD